MKVNCPGCKHFRSPQPVTPFAGGGARSAAESKAEREWMEQAQQRRAEEQRRLESRYPFHYEPEFHPWCAEKVPQGNELRALQQALRDGDEAALEAARADGVDFSVDPARGTVDPIYPLCAIKNHDRECKGYVAVRQPAKDLDQPEVPKEPKKSKKTKEPKESKEPKAPAASEEPPGPPEFRRIELDGEIRLGDRRQLLLAPDEPDDDEIEVRSLGMGPAHQFDATRAPDGSELGQELEFRLGKKSLGDLVIKDRGLTTSYGIFGAPGAGKTRLMKRMLRQLIAFNRDDPDRRFGGLILDPKAELVEVITQYCTEAGRADDLYVLGTGQQLNVIDSDLDPYELGSILVLAGRSAGIDASDPFWFQEWSNLFASTLAVLRAHAQVNAGWDAVLRPATLRGMLDAIFEVEPADEEQGLPEERRVLRLAREVEEKSRFLREAEVEDLRIDIQQLQRFYASDYVNTIEAFVTKAFGIFRRHHTRCFSDDRPRPVGAPPFYEDIVDSGRIVLVAIPPNQPVLAKTLCTLVKCLFQRAVLGRAHLARSGVISNITRPMLIACDEYSEIASEVPGQSMGDGQFLALARQYGCMAVFATQSVNVLAASSLQDNWRSVFSNFAAKIYMRLADNETAEEAVKLAGESEWRVYGQSTQVGGQGRSASRSTELRERKNLPSVVLTHRLKKGQAVVIGALDGGRKRPKTRFMKVPNTDDELPVAEWPESADP